MLETIASQLGQPVTKTTRGVWEKEDAYYSLPKEQRDAYLAQNPDLKAALQMKQAALASTPILTEYYGGIEAIQGYYRSQMYAALGAKYPDIQGKLQVWNELQLTDKRAATAFYKKNLKAYFDEKAIWQDTINRKTVDIGKYLNLEVNPAIRADAIPQGFNQQMFAQAIQPQQQMTWNDWQGVINSEPLTRLIQAYFVNGEELSRDAEKQLDYLAGKYGYNGGDDLLQAIGLSLYK